MHLTRLSAITLAVCLTSCGTVPTPVSASSFPKDVQDFLARRDDCDHWRGEWPDPPDKDRIKEILDAQDKVCTGTDAQLATLKRRYSGNASIMTKLSEYEDTIELPPTAP